ncbi:MAG: YggT family protein [Clostridia bacterium]|nr:YggT family protein [Clostridia bacterium]
MLFLGLRVSLNMVERLIMTVISLYEFMIVLRVLLGWLQRFNILPENRVSSFLTVVTEPVLSPIRETLMRVTGGSGIDFSPAVAIILSELLQWIVRLIF